MKNVKKWISFMLIVQRYADLPNSAIMNELEAEPAIVFHADGTPDMDKYCAVNNSYADAIWKYQKDAVCLVEDVGMNYFPEACAKHGINIASHRKSSISAGWHGVRMIHFHLQRSLPMEVLQ